MIFFRMWDVDKEENFVLNLEGQSGYARDELITCIDYSQNKGIRFINQIEFDLYIIARADLVL